MGFISYNLKRYFYNGFLRGEPVTRAQLENLINMILMILDDCKDLDEAKERVAGIVKKEQQRDKGNNGV